MGEHASCGACSLTSAPKTILSSLPLVFASGLRVVADWHFSEMPSTLGNVRSRLASLH